jgi:amino acid transporter
VSALLGDPALANFWNSTDGLLVSSAIVLVFAFIYVSLGMKWYARIQQALFYVGVAGLVLLVGGLLTTNPSGFESSFDSQVQAWGMSDVTYQGILTGTEVEFATLTSFNLAASYKLFPMLLFWIMWTVWGSTLFGEVREAGEYKKMFSVFEGALVAAAVVAIGLWFLFDAAIGYEFYQALNYNYFVGSGETQWLSSPTTIAAIAMGNGILAKLMAIMMAGWFFAWSGTVFLSSTRVIFATAFDRTIPEMFAEVKGDYNTPLYAILLMAIPAAILTLIYFLVPGFQTLTLAATFAIAITYFGTTIACMLFPWRRPELFSENPVAKYEIGGVPVISIVSGLYALILLSVFYLWATETVYGLNNVRSAGFMVFLYVLSGLIYVVMKYYRSQEGVELEDIHAEIPQD